MILHASKVKVLSWSAAHAQFKISVIPIDSLLVPVLLIGLTNVAKMAAE